MVLELMRTTHLHSLSFLTTHSHFNYILTPLYIYFNHTLTLSIIFNYILTIFSSHLHILQGFSIFFIKLSPTIQYPYPTSLQSLIYRKIPVFSYYNLYTGKNLPPFLLFFLLFYLFSKTGNFLFIPEFSGFFLYFSSCQKSNSLFFLTISFTPSGALGVWGLAPSERGARGAFTLEFTFTLSLRFLPVLPEFSGFCRSFSL